jgi:zinc transporter ZupT
VRFQPLRPASRGRLIAAFILGPIFWLVALVAAAVLLEFTGAILFGLAVTAGSFMISMLVLGLVYGARRRDEKRYAERR